MFGGGGGHVLERMNREKKFIEVAPVEQKFPKAKKVHMYKSAAFAYMYNQLLSHTHKHTLSLSLFLSRMLVGGGASAEEKSVALHV